MKSSASFNSSSILGVDRRLRLWLDSIAGTTQELTYSKQDYVTKIQHKLGNTIIRTDDFTYNEGSTIEKRTLNSGEILTITHTIASGETTYVLS